MKTVSCWVPQGVRRGQRVHSGFHWLLLVEGEPAGLFLNELLRDLQTLPEDL